METALSLFVFGCPIVGFLFDSPRLWLLGVQLLTTLGFTHWLMEQGMASPSLRPNGLCPQYFCYDNRELNRYTTYAFGAMLFFAWFIEGYLGDLIFAICSTLFIYTRLLVASTLLSLPPQ